MGRRHGALPGKAQGTSIATSPGSIVCNGQFRWQASPANGGRARGPAAQRIVTSSSAEVGWMAIVSSRSRLRAPIFTATAKPCRISSAPVPIRCTPSTRYSGPATTSFITQRGLRVVSAWYIGTKLLVYTFTCAPCCVRACASVSPTVPIGGWLKMTVGTCE